RLDPAHLADVLARGCLDLLAGGGRLQAPKRCDVAAHAPTLPVADDAWHTCPVSAPSATTQDMLGRYPASDQVDRRLLRGFTGNRPPSREARLRPVAIPPAPGGCSGIKAARGRRDQG